LPCATRRWRSFAARLATGAGRRHSTSLETLRQMIAAGAGYQACSAFRTLGRGQRRRAGQLRRLFGGRRPAGPSGLALAPERPAGGAVRVAAPRSADHPPAGTRADGERPDDVATEKTGARA